MATETQPQSLERKRILVGVWPIRVKHRLSELQPTVDPHQKVERTGVAGRGLIGRGHESMVVSNVQSCRQAIIRRLDRLRILGR